MNLLNILMKSLTSGAALQALANKTGLSEKQLKMILAIAIPLLLKKMTSNASSQSGAQSLLGALTQHQGKRSIADQLDDADEEDGAKIVGHILGEDKDDLLDSVAREAGASKDDVTKVLGNISPSVLNGLSTATQEAGQRQAGGVDLSDGIDMKDVMGLLGGSGLFGGGQSQSQGLLGSLLGGATPQEDQSVNGTQLINTLLSFM